MKDEKEKATDFSKTFMKIEYTDLMLALDIFTKAMRNTLEREAENGKSGWDSTNRFNIKKFLGRIKKHVTEIEELEFYSLEQELVDIANYAMFAFDMLHKEKV